MTRTPVFDIFGAYLSEAISLLGWSRLILFATLACVAGSVAAWGVAKILCRGQKQLGAALSSSFILLILAAIAAILNVALTFGRMLATEGHGPANALNHIGIAITVVLLFAGVHGAFGASWWKSAVLALVLIGSMGSVAALGGKFLFPDHKLQLAELANQVAGLPSNGPWLVKSEKINQQAELRKAHREHDGWIKRREALTPMYYELQTARASLNANDSAAVLAFNSRIAAYSQEKKEVVERLTQIEAILAKEPKPDEPDSGKDNDSK